MIGVLIVGVIAALLYSQRVWVVDALALVRTAQPAWLLAALGMVGLGYLLSSQVFGIVLRTFGHRLGAARLWLTATTAIVTTQCAPAGAVGGYIFLLTVFRRSKVSASQAALLATLEALSYLGAMLLVSAFGLGYLVLRPATTGALSLTGPGLALGLVGAILLVAAWLLSRPAAVLRSWAAILVVRLSRARRRSVVPRVNAAITELLVSRALVLRQRRLVLALVAVQSIALLSHSIALACVLRSLGVDFSLGAAVAAFGAALITSTFNLLPGGGGTVEAVLAGVLLYAGAGPAAVPAAILFRLLNFWALLPVAGAGYGWLLRAPSAPR